MGPSGHSVGPTQGRLGPTGGDSRGRLGARRAHSLGRVGPSPVASRPRRFRLAAATRSLGGPLGPAPLPCAPPLPVRPLPIGSLLYREFALGALKGRFWFPGRFMCIGGRTPATQGAHPKCKSQAAGAALSVGAQWLTSRMPVAAYQRGGTRGRGTQVYQRGGTLVNAPSEAYALASGAERSLRGEGRASLPNATSLSGGRSNAGHLRRF